MPYGMRKPLLSPSPVIVLSGCNESVVESRPILVVYGGGDAIDDGTRRIRVLIRWKNGLEPSSARHEPLSGPLLTNRAIRLFARFSAAWR